MSNQIALESLAMDLKRVAIGLHRGSENMAKRFFEESLKRKSEIDEESVKPYIKKILVKFPDLYEKESLKAAEDALMYSTLIQNYCTKTYS